MIKKKKATSNIEIINSWEMGFYGGRRVNKRITKNFREGQELGNCTWQSMFSLNYIIVLNFPNIHLIFTCQRRYQYIY